MSFLSQEEKKYGPRMCPCLEGLEGRKPPKDAQALVPQTHYVLHDETNELHSPT